MTPTLDSDGFSSDHVAGHRHFIDDLVAGGSGRQHGFESMLNLAQIAPLDQSVVLDVGSNTSSPLKNAHKLKSLMLILLWRFGCVAISDQQIFFSSKRGDKLEMHQD